MKKDNTYFFSFWTMERTGKEAGNRAARQMWEAIGSTWDYSLEEKYFYAMSPSKVGLVETSLPEYRENFS